MPLLRYAAVREFLEKKSAGKHFFYRCRHSFYGRGGLRNPGLTLGDSVSSAVLRSPCRHQLKNRLQTFSVPGQRIFHLRRDDGVDLAVHHLVALQLPEMLREHFFRQAGDPFAQLAETFGSALKIKQNQRFPFAADNIGGQLYRTIEFFHPSLQTNARLQKGAYWQ